MNIESHDILLSASQIEELVVRLAEELYEDYYRSSDDVVFLVVANGAVPFASDLLSTIGVYTPVLKCHVDTIKVRSYSTETNEQGALQFITPPDADLIKGRDVVIIDDIYDTGETMQSIVDKCLEHGATSIAQCVLLSKKPPNLSPEYTGLRIASDQFVYGYGLDLNGLYRNLQDIRVVGTENE